MLVRFGFQKSERYLLQEGATASQQVEKISPLVGTCNLLNPKLDALFISAIYLLAKNSVTKIDRLTKGLASIPIQKSAYH